MLEGGWTDKRVMTDPFQPMKRTGFELQYCPFFSIVSVLFSILVLSTSARAGGGGAETVPTGGNIQIPGRACWDADKWVGINAFYNFRGRRVNGFSGIAVDGQGPLQVTLEMGDKFFYSSGGKCLSFKPRHVNFLVLGPMDIKPNEAFGGTSEDLPIALQKRVEGPPYRVSWAIPVRPQGSRLMYFVSAYLDPQKWATDEQMLEMSAITTTQVTFLTEKERTQIDPDWLRRFPKIWKP